MQPIVGKQMASRRVKRPAPRIVKLRRGSLPRRRLREAKSIRRPAIARVEAVIQRERFPVVRLRPPVAVPRRDVVVKATFCVTAEAPTANAAGGVQVTPAGAVPVTAQVSVTVPVKLLLGVMTRATLPEVPAVTLRLVEVLPVVSATAKSGAGAPVPVRFEISPLGEALVTTWSWPVAEPTAVGVKTTLMAQVAPRARVPPQALVAAKGPVVVMLVMVTGVSPTLVRLTVCPLDVDANDGTGEGHGGGSENYAADWSRNGEVADGDVVVGGAGGGGGVVVGGGGEVGVEVRVGHVRTGGGELRCDDDMVEDLGVAVFNVGPALIGGQREGEVDRAAA